MSDNETAKHAAQLAMGTVQELAQRGGFNVGHAHGPAGKVAEYLVGGAAAAAPLVVAKAGVVTAAALGATAAAAPFIAIGLVSYGVYRLVKS